MEDIQIIVNSSGELHEHDDDDSIIAQLPEEFPGIEIDDEILNAGAMEETTVEDDEEEPHDDVSVDDEPMENVISDMPPTKKKKKKWVIALLAAFAVAAIVGLGAGIGSKKNGNRDVVSSSTELDDEQQTIPTSTIPPSTIVPSTTVPSTSSPITFAKSEVVDPTFSNDSGDDFLVIPSLPTKSPTLSVFGKSEVELTGYSNDEVVYSNDNSSVDFGGVDDGLVRRRLRGSNMKKY